MFNPLYDKPSLLVGCVEFVFGLIFFPGICWIVQMLIRRSDRGREYCLNYKINSNGVHDISNKITSSVFALCACSIGWFVNSQCNGDSIMNDRFYVLDNYLIFGVSYFFYDIISMYLVFNTLTKDQVTVSPEEILQFLSDRPLIVFHHILVPLIGFPAMMYFRDGYGDCLLGSSFLIEASTPFVSARVILVHLNMKESLVYMINGLMMLGSFFLCRVMIFPVLYWWYSHQLNMTLLDTISSIPAWVNAATILLWLPQLFWFVKMVKGSIKIVKDRQDRGKVHVKTITDNATSQLLSPGSKCELPAPIVPKTAEVNSDINVAHLKLHQS